MNFRDIEKAHIFQRCPRRALLEFGLLGTGIERIALDISSTTRRYIRDGIQCLVRGTLGHTGFGHEGVGTIVPAILKRYQDEVTTRGLEIEQGEEPFNVFLEQSALIEAVLRGYAMVERIKVKAAYDYLGEYEGIPVLEDKVSGEVYAYTVRVVPRDDTQTMIRDLHSLYTVAIGAMLAEKYGEDFRGTILHYIFVGERRRGESGVRHQASPFISGYKQQVGGRLAAKKDRKDKRTGHEMRLGNDFKRFEVWRPGSPLALDRWIEFLHEHKELEPLFRQVMVNPPQEDEGALALCEVRATCEHLDANLGDPYAQPIIFGIFPMHRHSCDIPVCPYQAMSCCYGDINFNDPLATAVFRQKEVIE